MDWQAKIRMSWTYKGEGNMKEMEDEESNRPGYPISTSETIYDDLRLKTLSGPHLHDTDEEVLVEKSNQ